MSKKIKVSITCKQVITYEKEIELTLEDFKILDRVNGQDVRFFKEDDAHSILENIINVYTDACDGDDTFLSFDMEKI